MRFNVPSLVSLRTMMIAAVLTAVFVPTAVYGQVTFSGARSTPVTGLSSPEDIATDTAGNLYISSGGGSVTKATLSGGVYTKSTIATGHTPFGIAVDGSGKIYIADLGGNILLETPSGGTYTQSILDSGLNNPVSIAVDAAGNLYVGSDTGPVYKETLSGGTYTRSTIANTSDENLGITVDGSGNVYVAALDNGHIFVETPSGGSYTQSTLITFTGGIEPWGIVLDKAGNIYISDFNTGVVYKETRNGSSYTQSALATGFSRLVGIALDAAGNLFVTDRSAGTITEFQSTIQFGSASIGTPTSLVAVPFSIAAGTTVGSVSVLTTGLPNKDFLDAGGSTCTAQTYASTTNCVVNVLFSGRSPGLRRGAVVLADGAGNALATVPLTGTAVGPQQAFFPANGGVIASSVNAHLISMDANSSVFIPDTANNQVLKLTSAGVLSTLATGIPIPTGTAVDGAGNVYVVNNGNQLTTIAPNGTQSTVTITGASNAFGVALDGQGDIYVADNNSGSVFMIAPDGTQSTFATGFTAADGLAVDALGNVYVSDQSAGTITKVTPAGVQSNVATGLNGPVGLAVDAAGDVYYALTGTPTIGQIPVGGSPTTLVAPSTGTTYGVAIDSSGSLFYSDVTNNTVTRLQAGAPGSFTFAQTVAGGTSSDSPQVGVMQNIGNALLTIASVVYPVDFPQDAAGSGTDCQAGPLASAAACTFFVDFKPTSAGGTGTTVVLPEAIRVTANNYNRAGTLFRILVTGTETKQVSSLVLSASSLTPLIGSGYTITATASGSGATPTGTVTFYSGNVFLTTGTLNGSGAATITGTLPAGLHTITATYGGDASYTTSTAAPLKVTVQRIATSVSVVSSANPAVSGTPITFTATVPTTLTGVPPTGKVSFMYDRVQVGQGTIVNGASNTATFTTSSLTVTHNLTVTYLGDANYLSASDLVGVRETITPGP